VIGSHAGAVRYLTISCCQLDAAPGAVLGLAGRSASADHEVVG
jgi:hypothetical protein